MKTHTYASMIMHFSTMSGHTYQNYQQPPQRSQNSDFQTHFSVDSRDFFSLKTIRLIGNQSVSKTYDFLV